jgi:hypothetical protein
MATAVEQAIAEIDERLATFAPQHEGLRDYALLNIQPHTLEAVRTMITQYDERVALLNRAKDALQALMTDGHPDIPIQDIDASALDDLKENAKTIEAALTRFGSNAATAMNLGVGKIEPK